MVQFFILITSLSIFITSGCSMKKVAILDLKNHGSNISSSIRLVDSRIPEIALSHMGKTGNIYSCYYGTRLLENDEIEPERLLYLENKLNLLVNGDFSNKELIVNRFTIYWNQHIEMRQGATAAMSRGMIGSGIATENMIPAQITVIGADITNNISSSLVGCNEPYSGSYLISELNGGNRPFVVYFEGIIEQKTINIRLVQPIYSPEEYKSGIQASIDALAQEILNQIKS